MRRWCSSTTSTSKASPSERAAASTSAKSTFTPTLKLGESTTGTRRAAASTRLRLAAVKPVEPITMATPRAAQASA